MINGVNDRVVADYTKYPLTDFDKVYNGMCYLIYNYTSSGSDIKYHDRSSVVTNNINYITARVCIGCEMIAIKPTRRASKIFVLLETSTKYG